MSVWPCFTIFISLDECTHEQGNALKEIGSSCNRRIAKYTDFNTDLFSSNQLFSRRFPQRNKIRKNTFNSRWICWLIGDGKENLKKSTVPHVLVRWSLRIPGNRKIYWIDFKWKDLKCCICRVGWCWSLDIGIGVSAGVRVWVFSFKIDTFRMGPKCVLPDVRWNSYNFVQYTIDT